MVKKYDLEKALSNPGETFKNPQEVLDNPHLENREKLTILKLWAHDIELMAVADTENMCGDDSCAGLMSRIHQAILSLKKEMRKSLKTPAKP